MIARSATVGVRRLSPAALRGRGMARALRATGGTAFPNLFHVSRVGLAATLLREQARLLAFRSPWRGAALICAFCPCCEP